MSCQHNLMKVEDEAIGQEPDCTRFICFFCGEVVHELSTKA